MSRSVDLSAAQFSLLKRDELCRFIMRSVSYFRPSLLKSEAVHGHYLSASSEEVAAMVVAKLDIFI
jgi:hypothetical protein